MKQELLKGKDGTLYFTPYVDNLPGVASSATVNIKKSNDTSVLAGVTCTINATTGEISYTITSTYLTELAENWKAEFTYTIGSVAYYQTMLFDVVLNKIAITVIDDDVIREQSDLKSRSESFTGVVDSSASTTLVDSDLKSYVDNYWNGADVVVSDPSTGVEQVRLVSDFTQSTGTVTVASAWTSNPTSSYTYILKRGFQNKVEASFEEMMFDIRAKGFRPALIIESTELHVPHIKKCLAMICRDLIQAPEDKFDLLSKNYEEQYKDYMSRLVLQYDVNESGTIDGSEKNKDLGNYRLKR